MRLSISPSGKLGSIPLWAIGIPLLAIIISAAVWEYAAPAQWSRQLGFLAIALSCVVIGFAIFSRAFTTQFHQLRESERQLRKSQQHFARAQELAEIGSFEGDLSKNKVVWSDNLYAILGVDKKTFVVTMDNFLALVHPDDRAGFKARYYPVMTDRAHGPYEYRIVRPDGEWRYLLRESEILRDGRGSVVGVIGTVRDVTKAKRAEQERLGLELQLQHAQRVEALGRLAGGIAHDLNNTMVPVVALSQLMLRKLPEASPERKRLEMIYQAGVHARDLVNQILAFSRKEVVQRQMLLLGDFIRDALPMMRAIAPSSIKISYTAQDGLPPILGDPTQLHQVVVNLITNAAQSIRAATGQVTIDVAMADAGERREVDGVAAADPMLCLSIRDTGCGMDKPTTDRIFEPFFTTKSVGEGTGLGLAVVHGIVRSHGGRIEVSSQIGSGTQFDIFLPAAQSQAERAGAHKKVDA